MTPRARVVSAVVMALVLLGLPVMPVLCDLACSEAVSITTVTRSQLAPHMADAGAPASCHDVSSARASAALASFAVVVTTVPLAVSPDHRCEHPAALAPRAPQSPRVPEPSPVAWDTRRRLSPFRAPALLVFTPNAVGGPSPTPGGAFSAVLRI